MKLKLGGASLILAERERQIEKEKFGPEHDDCHRRDQLALAAVCYAMPLKFRELKYWPWARYWWRPTPDDRIRELVKAGALIAAEIDRLQRQSDESSK